MYQRFIKDKVEKSLAKSPVTLITGPRQAGKTTLARLFESSDREYLTFDNQSTLQYAKEDPIEFIDAQDKVILDEVQLVPELFRTIKLSVDNDRRYGRFLLTGSANVIEMPEMADSLVGRIRLVELLPFTRAEILGISPTFLENLFAGNFQNTKAPIVSKDDLIHLTLLGGFPEIFDQDEETRQAWFDDYIRITIVRDLGNIALTEKLDIVPDIIELLAPHSGQLLNYSKIASDLKVHHNTVRRYIKLLERLYVIKILQPFHLNVRHQLVKTPKIHFLDTGLLAFVASLNFDQLKRNRAKFGSFLENFVLTEILKLITSSSQRLNIYHFRNNSKFEVDIVLQDKNNMIAGIEVKTGITINFADFIGLRNLLKLHEGRFVFGVILYNGDRVQYYGNQLAAVPISALWA